MFKKKKSSALFAGQRLIQWMALSILRETGADAELKLITAWSPAFSFALVVCLFLPLCSHHLKIIFLSSSLPLGLFLFWLYETRSKIARYIIKGF